MKAKQLLLSLTAGVALSLFFGSCAGDMSITKRHYTKGYYISMRDHGASAATTVAPNATAAVAEPAQTVNSIPAETKTAETVVAAAPVQQTVATKTTAHNATVKHASKTATAQPLAIAPSKKTVKAAVRQAKRTTHPAPGGGDAQILAVILAILLPPIGVLVYEGSLTNHFWIDLLLTLLFFIPGVIYALLVVLDAI
jgi:uncharacterized membrane protein YqaE (UPF0057 family)